MTVLIYPKLVNSSATDLSAYAVLPYTYQDTKDESLGSAQITLQGLKRKRPFKPYLRVDIDGVQWLIANDKVTVSLARKDLYKHELTLIEPTKLLELYMMCAKRYTVATNHEYNTGVASGIPICYEQQLSGSEIDFDYWRQYGEKRIDNSDSHATYSSPTSFNLVSSAVYRAYAVDGQTIPTLWIDTPAPSISGARYGICLCKSNDGIVASNVISYQVATGTGSEQTSTRLSLTAPTEEGTYFFYYVFSYDSTTSFSACVPFSIISNGVVLTDYTLSDIAGQLFDIVQPIKTSTTPKFSLTTSAQTLLNVTAPEMSFTDGATLWENLSQIGKVIQARPKLLFQNNACKIDFEKIGTRAEHSLSGCQLVQNELSMNASEYANKVTATVSNMKNYDSGNLSLACEPSKDTFKSLRTNSDTCRIKDENGIIETDNPIEAIISLECLISSGGTQYTLDLTPYVYEATEYAFLSSYSASYPKSKIMAIYYTKGQKNIEGLWYRAQDSGVGLIDSFEQYSIVNIIQIVSSQYVSGGITISSHFPNLMFRIKYISSVDGIVEQYTQNPSCSEDIAITTTQNTNEPNSTFFGKGLLGEAMMMGNVGESRTYISSAVANLPTINDTIDGMFVTVATYQVFRNYALCTVNLTENYNELSAYNRISKEIRQYEIPNGQDRNFLMRSFLQIISSNQETLSGYSGGGFDNATAYNSIYNSLTARTSQKIGNMIVTFKDDNGSTISEVTLPCMAIPVGNSIYFFGRCADNYAVGYKSQDAINDSSKTKTDYRMLQAVNSGDVNFGRAKSIKIVLSTDIAMASGHDTYNDKLSVANAMPEKSSLISYTTNADSGDLIVWKDGAETLIIGWQLHFVSPTCIISPDFAYTLGFCNPMTHGDNAKIYFFNHLLNPDLSNCTGGTAGNLTFQIYTNPDTYLKLSATPTNCKSWAVKDITTGKWLFGENNSFGGSIFLAFNDTYDYSENTISLT